MGSLALFRAELFFFSCWTLALLLISALSRNVSRAGQVAGFAQQAWVDLLAPFPRALRLPGIRRGAWEDRGHEVSSTCSAEYVSMLKDAAYKIRNG